MAGDSRGGFDEVELGHGFGNSRPELVDYFFIIPDDTSAVADFGYHALFAPADVDHSLFPHAARMSFGGTNESGAFGFAESVVNYGGVEAGVFGEWGLGPVDFLDDEV